MSNTSSHTIKVLADLLCDNADWSKGYCDFYGQVVYTVEVSGGRGYAGETRCPQCKRTATDEGVGEYWRDYTRA